MRLPKKIYFYDWVDGDSTDWWGTPEPTKVLGDFFGAEVEPYSSELAKNTYGVFVTVTNRVFCKPDERIKINVELNYRDTNYRVTQVMDYGKHYEVLIERFGN